MIELQCLKKQDCQNGQTSSMKTAENEAVIKQKLILKKVEMISKFRLDIIEDISMQICQMV